MERAGSVILRLTDAERDVLQILIASLKVSEYTDDVDCIRSYQSHKNMEKAIGEVYTTITGLSHVANNLPKSLLDDLAGTNPQWAHIAEVVGDAVEIGRRFKRMNPDKMRSEYGKLIMLLQDVSTQPGVPRSYRFESLSKPVATVGELLKKHEMTAVLKDPLIACATQPLKETNSENVDAKEAARQSLIHKYAKSEEEKRELLRAILSIDDAHNFVEANTRPIQTLISFLEEFTDDTDTKYSLRIRSGSGGSCLSHSHTQQLQYVKEALTLWRVVQRDIFDFWETVESDMLSSRYTFRNTGQGFHRVCSGAETYSRMMGAISEAHSVMGGWVGSKVVHLGDNDVPNALVFIDKYTIIPRLVTPIVQCIEAIDNLCKNQQYPGMQELLISGFDSVEDLKKSILCDFFKHGFDGSGDDGGSCIDGRLTSAWNWCSRLHKKKFCRAFQLTGFTGFDANYN